MFHPTPSTLIAVALLATSAPAQYVHGPCPGGQCPVNVWSPSTYAPRSIPSAIPAATPHPAVCRVVNTTGQTESIGSGTLISSDDHRGLVLTCAHLFSDGTGRVIVQFPSGGRYEARVVGVDQPHDLAALVIARPGAGAVEPTFTTPTGELTACGYGPDGRYACFRGPVAGYATPVGARHPSLQMRGAARSGDSGGPVLDRRGRLVGVIWGQRDGLTYATFGQPLREFLARTGRGNDQGNQIAERPLVDTPSTYPDDSPLHPAAEPRADEGFNFAAFDKRLTAVEEEIKRWPAADELVTRDQAKDFARTNDLQQCATKDQLAALDQESIDRQTTVVEHVERQLRSTTTEAKRAALDAVGERLRERAGMFEGLSVGRLLLGSLGITSPLGLAIFATAALLRHRARSNRQPRPVESLQREDAAHDGERGGLPSTIPIAVDSPPPPQRTVPQTHYVPYERDGFSKAYQWASEQVARKYPGSIETLTTLDSLIKQQVNASSE